MKIIVKLEDINTRETMKGEQKSIMLRAKGRDKTGDFKTAYMFDAIALSFETKLLEITSSGVDYKDLGAFVEFNGFEKTSTRTNGTFFSVDNFTVLQGAELELQKIRFSASDLERKLKSLNANDLTARYDIMADYLKSHGINVPSIEIVKETLETTDGTSVEDKDKVVLGAGNTIENVSAPDVVGHMEVETSMEEITPQKNNILQDINEVLVAPHISVEEIKEPEIVEEARETPVDNTPEATISENLVSQETTEVVSQVETGSFNSEKIDTDPNPSLEIPHQDIQEITNSAQEIAEVKETENTVIEPKIVEPVVVVEQVKTEPKSRFRTIRALEETVEEITPTLPEEPEVDATRQLGNPPPPPKPKSLFTKSSPFGRPMGGGSATAPTTSAITPEATTSPVVTRPELRFRPMGRN